MSIRSIIICVLFFSVITKNYAQQSSFSTTKQSQTFKHSFGATLGLMSSGLSYKLSYGSYATQVTAIPIWDENVKYMSIGLTQIKAIPIKLVSDVEFVLYGACSYNYQESNSFNALTSKIHEINLGLGGGGRIIVSFLSLQGLLGLRPHLSNGTFRSNVSIEASIFLDL